jgi:hypothetical protein
MAPGLNLDTLLACIENCADGLITVAAMEQERESFSSVTLRSTIHGGGDKYSQARDEAQSIAKVAFDCAASADASWAAGQAAFQTSMAMGWFLFAEERTGETDVLNNTDSAKEQLRVVREIFGNPFRPYPAPPSWPSTVVQLAESLYAGQDCAFALHDALLEAGHPDLGEHFREKDHPKGCWVLDLILGKK